MVGRARLGCGSGRVWLLTADILRPHWAIPLGFYPLTERMIYCLAPDAPLVWGMPTRLKPLLVTMADPYVLIMSTNVPQELHFSATSVIINKFQLSALFDSCSIDSYISDRIAQELKLEIHLSKNCIILARKSLNTISMGYVVVNLGLCLNG